MKNCGLFVLILVFIDLKCKSLMHPNIIYQISKTNNSLEMKKHILKAV